MFPNDNTDVIVEKVAQGLKTAQNVLNSFDFDAQKKEYTIKDGSPVLVDELEATKQWIRRFLATDINTLEIYEGYKFGTSYKKLLGSKNFGNGYIESEIEREIREGFLLCPSIKKIISYDSEKQGTKLCLRIVIALHSGVSAQISANLGN